MNESHDKLQLDMKLIVIEKKENEESLRIKYIQSICYIHLLRPNGIDYIMKQPLESSNAMQIQTAVKLPFSTMTGEIFSCIWMGPWTFSTH